MNDNLTLLHALSKNSNKDLKRIAQKYNPTKKIDPNAGKPKLISDIVPMIPQKDYEGIIDSTFNTPKTRYTAHLGRFDLALLSENDINENCDSFNNSRGYKEEIPSYLPNHKEHLELIKYDDKELIFYFTATTKKPEFDEDAMESRPIVYSKKIRVQIKPEENQISVFTGDKDLVNDVLSALTNVFGHAITPLTLNKTGISELDKGSFSFQTVKVVDYIYHGLSKLGRIGVITQIDLESPSNQKPQRVKVQGEDLLDDKSICEYLLIHARDLVGVKLDLILIIGENEHKINIELGLRDNRIKLGIKRDKYSIEQITNFYHILEDNLQFYLRLTGLIDNKDTSIILDNIRKKALND